MHEPIRHATTPDGVSIAYHVMGSGSPLVMAPPVPWSNVKTELEFEVLREWWERQASWATVARYDCRGTGLSDRSSVDFSLGAQVRDLSTVVDALELETFALLAPFVGTPAAVAYAAQHPDRVSHLLLWHPCLNGAALYPDFASLEKFATQHWEMFTETFAHVIAGWSHGDASHEYAAYLRTCVTQDALVSALPLYKSLDATAYAPRVRAPTLAVTRRGLAPIALDMARDAAERIADARFVLLEGTSAVPYVGDGDAVVSLFQEFISSPARMSASAPAAEDAAHRLTDREIEVLSLLAGGHTAKEIATALGVSPSTAQRHIANIYAKIGARGRVDAAAYALARGLVRARDDS